MIEGTIDYFLAEVGQALDDTTLALTADGTVRRDRTVNAVNAASRNVLRRLLACGVRGQTLARRVTLTADSDDGEVSLLPYRTLAVLSVEDGSENPYRSVYSRKRTGESGFIVDRRASTTGSSYTPAIRWWGVGRPNTVYAWVIEEPPKLSYGLAAAYAATSLTLATTPTAGPTMENDDYYNGVEVGIVYGTYAGQVREISDYAGSTHVATVGTWTNTPTAATDYYSILTTLPRLAWDAAITEAVYRIAAMPDSRWHDERGISLSHLKQNQDNAFREALQALGKPVLGAAHGPREAVVWSH